MTVLTPEQIAQNEASRLRFAAIYEGLKAPFPTEAMSVDSSRGFDLTSVKAQYVIERLNDVVGIDGWELVGGFQTVEGGVLYEGKLVINDGFRGHGLPAIGFSTLKKNIGDAYKGAQTDALSKAASKFGLANEVFKGNVKPVKGSVPKNSAPKPQLKNVVNDDF